MAQSSTKPTRVFIRTFGCQMNEYDSARMIDLLGQSQAGGIETIDDPAQADIVLYNTCSVREKAQEKVFSDLGRLRELKRQRPELVTGVGGFVTSPEGQNIVSPAP
jgi:tRNA-2-methylthio-N6-dimethylallyladenosine synthase